MIYFVNDGRWTKIGYTQDEERLAGRVRSLQCGNPRPLVVAAAMKHGGPRTERALHLAFAAHRERGEWFRRNAGLTRVIEAAREGADPKEVVEIAQAAQRAAHRTAERRRFWAQKRRPKT